MRVLVLSNLDSSRPFGQSTRPFFLARGLADLGLEVGSVGVDCSGVDFGPSWSTGTQSFRRFAVRLRTTCREFRPQVLYAHQNLPATTGLLAARQLPLVADFHALPSLEWAALVRDAGAKDALVYRAAGVRALVLERYIARSADGIIAAGEETARAIVDRHAPPTSPTVVLNGVDHRLVEAPRDTGTPFPDDGPDANVVAVLPITASPSNARALAFLCRAAVVLARGHQRVAIHVLGTSQGPRAPLLHYQGLQPDLLPWLDHASACLLPYPSEAPLYGGAKNKLLEYLARAQRIVTTREGLRGLQEAAEWEGVELAPDDPAGFAEAIVAAALPNAPRLDERRTAVRERLRWDVLARSVAPRLRAVARRDSAA